MLVSNISACLPATAFQTPYKFLDLTNNTLLRPADKWSRLNIAKMLWQSRMWHVVQFHVHLSSAAERFSELYRGMCNASGSEWMISLPEHWPDTLHLHITATYYLGQTDTNSHGSSGNKTSVPWMPALLASKSIRKLGFRIAWNIFLASLAGDWWDPNLKSTLC